MPRDGCPCGKNAFAKSGRLLKTFEILEVFQVDGRWYPQKARFKDALSQGQGTEWLVDSIDFSVKIPDYKFSKASLRK